MVIKRAAADPNDTDSRRGAHGMTVWVPRAGGRPNTLPSPPLRQHFYMTWHLWGSVAIRSEMAEIQDCACCQRPTAGLYQLQLGRCTASDPQKPPWRPRRLSQAQRSSLKGSKDPFSSHGTFIQKRAILTACLRKVQKMASTRELLINSGRSKIREFQKLAYPNSILKGVCTFLAATTGNDAWIAVRSTIQ